MTLGLPRVAIVFLTYNNYAKYLAVAMASVLKNSSNLIIEFNVISSDLSDENKEKITELKRIKDFSINYISVSDSDIPNCPSKFCSHIGNEILFRLQTASLCKHLDKCIFLDADLVCVSDIQELWNIDVSDCFMAAVPDQAAKFKDSWAKKLPLPSEFEYINAGVTVMNLKKWREHHVEDKFMHALTQYDKLLGFPEQDLINIVLHNAIKLLDNRFNVMPMQPYYDEMDYKTAMMNPVIIHWAGYIKPWNNLQAKSSSDFFKYLKLTPYYETVFLEIVKIQVDDCINRKKISFSKYIKYYLLSKICFWNKKHYKKLLKDNIP